MTEKNYQLYLQEIVFTHESCNDGDGIYNECYDINPGILKPVNLNEVLQNETWVKQTLYSNPILVEKLKNWIEEEEL